MDAAAWDARYAAADLVWSSGPNVWVREVCAPLPPGRAVDLAAGEGRNALWLVEQGWHVVAADFSPVGVARIREIADRRLDASARARLEAVVADATDPAPASSVDLALLSYLHLPWEQWVAALRHAVAAVRPGGLVLVVAHARRNLAEGVGGPQDPAILLDPEGVVDSAAGLPVVVETSGIRYRSVEGEPGHGGAPEVRRALDTVVVLRRT
jgi:SAM-dependent methyltransferase